MATQVQFRRGTTAEHSSFKGAVGEVTVDTSKNTVVIHDAIQAGGPAGTQRLTLLKNAETMADALNAYMPTVRKFSEQAKKDELTRQLAAAGVRQNIATNARLNELSAAASQQAAMTGLQQTGSALTQQYNYA